MDDIINGEEMVVMNLQEKWWTDRWIILK